YHRKLHIGIHAVQNRANTEESRLVYNKNTAADRYTALLQKLGVRKQAAMKTESLSGTTSTGSCVWSPATSHDDVSFHRRFAANVSGMASRQDASASGRRTPPARRSP